MSARAAQPHPHEVQDRELSLRQTTTPGSEGVNPILLLAGNTSLWLAKAIRARHEISTSWEKNPWAWRQGLLQSQRAWRHRGAPGPEPPMPTPLQLNDEEMDLLLTLAAPIEQRQRDQFLVEVAAELEAASSQTVSGPALVCCIGSGASFRGNISIRRSSAKANIGGLRSLFA
jgi:hypothetical protein